METLHINHLPNHFSHLNHLEQIIDLKEISALLTSGIELM